MGTPAPEPTTTDAPDAVRLVTSRFGAIDVDPASVLAVPDGIPGFPDLRRVALLACGSVPGFPPVAGQHTMFWMQDLDDGDLAFLCIQPWVPFPDYEIDIDESALGIASQDDVAVLAIVTVRRGDGQVTMAANLRAPIVVDTGRGIARQVILTGGSWPVSAVFAATAPVEVG